MMACSFCQGLYIGVTSIKLFIVNKFHPVGEVCSLSLLLQGKH